MSFLETRNAIRNFFVKEVELKPIQQEHELEESTKTPNDFNVGEVYQMAVAKHSHVKSPYYIIIKEVGSYWIVTDIPNEHSLKITQKSYEWNYHIPRMKLIGTDEKSKSLIYGQQNLIK